MAGLLELLNSGDPGLLTALALMQSGSAQPVRQSFGGGLLSAMQVGQQAKQAQEEQAMKRQQFGVQQQQAMAQLAQLQRQAADQQRMDAWRDSIPAPQGQPLPAGPYQGAARDSQAANVPQPTAVDPMQQAMFSALKAGAINPLQYFQSMHKDTAPIKLGAGEALIDPRTLKPIASNPKEHEQPGDWKLYQLSGAQARGMSFDEWDIARRRAGAASTTVSLGSPVQIDTPNGPALYQPSNRPGQPGQIVNLPGTTQPARPYEKPSDKMREAQRENAASLDKVERAINAVKAYPDALGGQNYLDVGGAVMQRTDPKGIEARALVADIGSQKIHDRSGAAVTASETPRLRPFIPSAADPPAAAIKKMELFRRELQFMQQELNSGGTIQQVSTQRAAPAGQAASGVKFLGFEK